MGSGAWFTSRAGGRMRLRQCRHRAECELMKRRGLIRALRYVYPKFGGIPNGEIIGGMGEFGGGEHGAEYRLVTPGDWRCRQECRRYARWLRHNMGGTPMPRFPEKWGQLSKELEFCC